MSIENPYHGREAVMFDFAVAAKERGEFFCYVLIPGNIKPLERCERFEDPLALALSAALAGEVTGGGSQLGEDDTIEFCGLDVVLTDHKRGFQLLKEELRRLQAPVGTIIEEYLPARIDHPLYK